MNNRVEQIKTEIYKIEETIVGYNVNLQMLEMELTRLKNELYNIEIQNEIDNVDVGDYIYFKYDDTEVKTMLVQDVKGRYDIMLLTNTLFDECESYQYGTYLGYKCLFMDTLIKEIDKEHDWKLIRVEKNENVF